MTIIRYTLNQVKKARNISSSIFLLLCILSTSLLSGQVTTLAAWNFDDMSVNASSFTADNNGKKLTSSQSIGWNADNGGGEAASAENWNGGGGSDYWQVEVNTTGFESITVSSWQKGSNSGPANFKLQYRIGTSAAFTDVAGATVTMTNSNWANYGRLTDAVLPSGADNESIIQIRWLMANNTGINGSNVQSGGNSRIDDIVVTGIPSCSIPATPTGTAAVNNNPSCGPATLTYDQTAPSGVTFYWQTSATGTATTTAVTSSRNITATTASTTYRYIRAKSNVGNCWSGALDTGIGVITIRTAPSISVHPTDRSVALGTTNIQFPVSLSAPTGTTLQWQVSTDNGGNWTDLSNTAPYSGVTTSNLRIATATTDLHKNLYRLVASNSPCNTATSNPALFLITGAPIINAQPTLTYEYCNSAKIEMAATNAVGSQEDLVYNWFVFPQGSNDWVQVANDGQYSGADSNILYINSLVGLNRSQYYVQVGYKSQPCYVSTKAVGVVSSSVPTRWDGTSWSHGAPDQNSIVILEADYDTNTANLIACSLDLGSYTLTVNEDQFVQVESVISGTGTIDIKNNGSLVQVENDAHNGEQWRLLMERITKKMYRYDYTYWSSPIATMTLKDLSPDTLIDKYHWWNAGAHDGDLGWQTVLGGEEEMTPGKGYIVRAPQTDSYGINPDEPDSYNTYTANFMGLPNNGVVRYPVAGGTEVYNLIGNPYPCAIDADQFLTENIANGAILGTLYFWTHNTPNMNYEYSDSDYAAYNRSGGVTTEAPSDVDDDPDNVVDNSPRGKIAAGQSFFVEGNDTLGTAVFNNAMRITGENSQFYKTSPTEPINGWDMQGKHRLWLNLKNDQKGFNQILVGYIENATNGYDLGYDGKSFSGNQVTFYSINDQDALTIQARALPFNNQDEVPLGYKSTMTGTLTISIDHYDGIFEGQEVYLEDKLLNIMHDLKQSAYGFATAAGTFNQRFVLRYANTTLGNDTPDNVSNAILIYKEENTMQIKSLAEALEEVTVYDLLGRVIYQQKNIAENELAISNVVMNQQALIARVKLTNGSEVSKKIIY